MPVLSKAPAPVVDFVAGVVEAYHPAFVTIGLRIDLMMADPTEKEQDDPPPYIKLHGYPCAAIVKKLSAEQRAKGNGDAQITLDGETWRGLDDDERTALIDHELEHLVPSLSKDGQVKRDAYDRPVLKMRLHDLVLGGFESIIRRHGNKSIDAQELQKVFEGYRQKYMSWMDDSAPQDERPDIAGVVSRAAV